jgi:transposase-like protein
MMVSVDTLTLVAGASVSRVARRHDVNANQLFYWRKLYREGRLGARTATQLLPVKVTDSRSAEAAQGDGLALRRERWKNQACERNCSHCRVCGCDGPARRARVSGVMIGLPAGTRIRIAAGVTDLRRGFTGLSGMVQTVLHENPFPVLLTSRHPCFF